MNTITIQGKIEKGIIQLSETYKKYENATVFLIIVLENEKQNQKQALTNIFNSMKDVKMFENIENPVEWQKKIRDEWE